MGRGAAACDVFVNVGMTANQDTVQYKEQWASWRFIPLGSHIVWILLLEWTMHCSFDSNITRVGAGIIGEVFSGGEEGPGSLARYLRVGRHSESPGATFTFHR